jgi:hypothetical protein
MESGLGQRTSSSLELPSSQSSADVDAKPSAVKPISKVVSSSRVGESLASCTWTQQPYALSTQLRVCAAPHLEMHHTYVPDTWR